MLVRAEVAVGTAAARFVSKTVIIPHDKKKFRGGEDAAATSSNLLVVADGVGGWVQHNVNPGLYSQALVNNVIELGSLNETAPLVDIVHAANWNAANQHLGSATCTTLRLTSKNELESLNVGDSGYSIHRRGAGGDNDWKLVFASEPGQKRFNFPDQLGGRYGDEVADVAVPKSHKLEPDDLIVVYSDGVSDNLFPEQFHECLLGSSYSWMADCIARSAYVMGKDKTFLSPFSIGARQAGWGDDYTGGKHDDITVVVAQVASDDGDDDETDPYFSESIYLYTGPVAPKEELPDPNNLNGASKKDEL